MSARLVVFAIASLQILTVRAQGAPDQTQSVELTTLRDSVKDLSDQLAELTVYLRTVLPPSPVATVGPVEVSIKNAAVQGDPTAKLVLLEFADFECPFCGQYFQTSYRQILTEFVETGWIQYVARNMPLAQLHPEAFKAAEAAECAGVQGQFWQMHGRLYSNQKALNVAALGQHAKELGLDEGECDSCLSQGLTARKVRDDITEAQRLGITGTPTFLIGFKDQDDRVRVTRRITGAQPFHVFQAALRQLLNSPQKTTDGHR